MPGQGGPCGGRGALRTSGSATTVLPLGRAVQGPIRRLPCTGMQPFGERPVVVGHRGALRCAPENTPAAFSAAAEAGAQWVELDVRRAADGLAVRHDPRLPDGRAVVDVGLGELARLGVWSLPEVLSALPDELGLDVEVKNLPLEPGFDRRDAIVAEVAGLLGPLTGTRPLCTSSFNPRTVAALVAALPWVPAGLVCGRLVPARQAGHLARRVGARVACVHVSAPRLDAAAVAAMHAAGLAVLVWTVDDVACARRLTEWGVDALCTNEVSVMVAALC